ncbi:hypothetical protein ABMA08_07965 [Pseudomonas yamanorum]
MPLTKPNQQLRRDVALSGLTLKAGFPQETINGSLH